MKSTFPAKVRPPFVAPTKIKPQLLEAAYLTLAFLAFGSDFFKVLFAPPDAEINPAGTKYALLLVYLIAIGLIFRFPAKGAKTLLQVAPLAALIAIPALSMLWTVDAQSTSVRMIQLIGTSFVGIYLGSRIRPDRFLHLLAVAAVVSGLFNLFLCLFVPEQGIDTNPAWAGAWRGGTSNKNALGSVAALSFLILLAYLVHNRWRNYPFYAAGLLVNLLLIVNAQSTTSLATAILCGGILLTFPFFTNMRRRFFRLAVLIGLILALGLAILLLTFGISGIAAMLGKSADMTGRLPIWLETWSYIQQRYWLGYGYFTFWDKDYIGARIIAQHLNFAPAYSHNGLLELWLNAGVVGVILFAIVMVRFIFNLTYILFLQPNRIIWTLAAVFLVFFLLQNFAEAHILIMNNLQWCLFIAFHLMIIKELARVRNRPDARTRQARSKPRY